jgi:hypothetical protein
MTSSKIVASSFDVKHVADKVPLWSRCHLRSAPNALETGPAPTLASVARLVAGAAGGFLGFRQARAIKAIPAYDLFIPASFGLFAPPFIPLLALHGHLQFVECVIPLLRDHIERTSRLFQLCWLKLPQAFASNFYVVYQACIR